MLNQEPAVVLVNDEPMLLSAMTHAMENAGLTVTAFARGSAALEDAAIATASVIVSDWTNPPLGGHGLWQELRARRSSALVVFVSPHADDIEALFKGAEVRPTAIVASPFIPRKLVAIVTGLLARPAA